MRPAMLVGFWFTGVCARTTDGSKHSSTQTEFNGWDEENIVTVVKTVTKTRPPTEADLLKFAESRRAASCSRASSSPPVGGDALAEPHHTSNC